MKFFNIALLLVVLTLAFCLSSTFAQDDAGAAPKRPALRRPAGKAAKTTTAAPPPPKEEEADYGDENQDQYGDEGEENGADSSTTTTSTEPPKKVGPVIRPFRSNDDFLNSLKRRQMDAKKNRAEKAAPRSKPAPAAASAPEDGDEADESAPAPAPAKGFKGGNPALNRRKLTKPGKPEPPAEDTAEAESEQEPKEDTKARRLPQTRLALRKRV